MVGANTGAMIAGWHKSRCELEAHGLPGFGVGGGGGGTHR